MRHVQFATFIVCIPFLLSVGANAAAARDKTASRTLVVGTEDIDYLPFYGWQNGRYGGAARQILDAFAKDDGYRLIFRPYPIRRLYAQLVTGRIDLKFPDNSHWAAAAKAGHHVYYSRPLLHFTDGTIVRAGERGRGLAAIHTLGTVLGFTPTAWTGRIATGQVRVRQNPRLDQLLRQVRLGRVDGAYCNIDVARHVAANLSFPAGSIVYDPALPHVTGGYRLSTTTRPKVITAFDKWLATHQATITAVERRYDLARITAAR